MFDRRQRIRLPRYRLKTLLLLVSICCLGVAWISHHQREYAAEQSAIAALFDKSPTPNTYTLVDDDRSQWLSQQPSKWSTQLGSKHWQSRHILGFR